MAEAGAKQCHIVDDNNVQCPVQYTDRRVFLKHILREHQLRVIANTQLYRKISGKELDDALAALKYGQLSGKQRAKLQQQKAQDTVPGTQGTGALVQPLRGRTTPPSVSPSLGPS